MDTPDQSGRWGKNYAAAMRDSFRRNRMRIAVTLLQSHGGVRDRNVFDFGCGDGSFIRALRDLGARATGCDPSPDLIAAAPGGAQLGGVELLEQLPAESVDILTALNVLSYLTPDQYARFWPAAHRALKPAGVLLHTAPNAHASSPNRDHFWVKNPDTYPDELRASGFEETARAFAGYYPRIFKWHRLDQLTGLFARGGRVYHPWRLALVPERWKAKRSTMYFSLAIKGKCIR